MRGAGRPRKITRAMVEKICTMLEHGLTESQISEILGINRTTLWEAKQNRQFSNMVLRSKDNANRQVIKSLFLRATGFSVPTEKLFCHEGEVVRAQTRTYYPPDVGAATLWLINQTRTAKPEEGGPWRKEIQHEDPGTQRPPIIRILERVHGKEAAAIRATGDSVSVLLGADFVAEVKATENSKQTEGTNGNGTHSSARV